jgi:hypothetical protein
MQLVLCRRLQRFGYLDREEGLNFELTVKGHDYVATGAAREHDAAGIHA